MDSDTAEALPAPLQTVAHLLPSYYHASVGMAVVSGQTVPASDWLVLAGYAVGLSALVAWRHRVEELKGVA